MTTTPSQTQPPQIDEVRLEAWKGATGAVRLGRCTLLVGAAATGKSSILQALQYGLGAGVAEIGKASQPGELLDLVGPGDRGAVELRATTAHGQGPVSVRRMLWRVAGGGRQQVRCSAGPLESNRNEDHEAAAAGLLGDFPIMLDIGQLLGMSEDAQRVELLRLCGMPDSATVEIFKRRILAAQPAPLPEGSDQLDPFLPPLTWLQWVCNRAKEAEKEAEKAAKAARADAKAEPAPFPSRDEGDAARARLKAAEQRSDQLRERKGVLQHLIEQGKHAAEHRQLMADTVASIRMNIAAGVERLATLVIPTDVYAESRAVELERVEQDLAAIDLTAIDEAARSAREACAAQQLKVAAAHEAAVAKERDWKDVDAIVAQLASGSCPLCGSPCAESHIELQAQAQALMDEARLLNAVDAEFNVELRTKTERRIEAEKILSAGIARQKALETEQRTLLAHAADAAARVADESKATLAEKARVEANLVTLRTNLAEFEGRLAAAQQGTQQGAQGQPLRSSGTSSDMPAPEPAAELEALLPELAEAEKAEAQAHDAVIAWDNADAEAVQSRREIDRAKEDARRLTAARDAQRKLQEVARVVEAEVLGEIVDPLILCVRGIIDDADFGAFTVDFSGGGCRLGVLRTDPKTSEEYFVRFRRGVTSGGEVAALSLAMIVALARLREPALRIALLDDVYSIDPGSQAGFVSEVAGMVARGDLDQAVMASHYLPQGLDAQELASLGVTVVDVSGLRAGARAQSQSQNQSQSDQPDQAAAQLARA